MKLHYVSFTGFHCFSYLFSRTIYMFFRLIGKISSLCRSTKCAVRAHPYDCVPLEYETSLVKLIYLLEVLSFYCKALEILLRIAIFRPHIVLLDEGFPHVMLNYLMFFYTRKSMLYKSLNRHVVRFLQIFSRHSNEFIILYVLPTQNRVIDYWMKRDPCLPRSLVIGWTRTYYTLMPAIIKLIEKITNKKILVFNDIKKTFHYILDLLGAEDLLS
jgi:hypothetical protein